MSRHCFIPDRAQLKETLMYILSLLLTALICVVAAEIVARVTWSRRCGVPFRYPGRVLLAFYPEMRKLGKTPPNREDGFFNVLLLGGSLMGRAWGAVEQTLSEQLAVRGYRNVRIFNLSVPGQTSRDGWLKYAALGHARFELVVFSPSISDARANNVPPALFRHDYAHYASYETLNAMACYHGATDFALLYSLHYLALRTRYNVRKKRYVPFGIPRQEWLRYGMIPQNDEAFRNNVSAIVELAECRGDRLVLMTLAAYDPPDYSREAFEENRLDFALHLLPFEKWGKRENVLAALSRQNDTIRALASGHEGVVLVDQDSLIPRSASNFNDPFHLTVIGSYRFAKNLLNGLVHGLGK
jgi:hypothetical protein